MAVHVQQTVFHCVSTSLLLLWLQGVRAVIAESFEKLHRNQLVGMGIMPLQFLSGQNADSLELSGKERFSITLPESLSPGQELTVKVWNTCCILASAKLKLFLSSKLNDETCQ